jgi:hypothetical protein
MAGIRELLAIALGALLGLACIARPTAVARLSVVGRTGGPTQDPRNEYGTDNELTGWRRRTVQALGVVCVGIAGVIAYQTFA